MERYKYYQPNRKDIKDKYGDCSVRAICKAEGMEWLDAYDLMWRLTREIQCPLNIKNGYEHILKSLGYKYTGISNRKGTTRPTVKEFADKHRQGTYILVVANHYVAVVDGIYYDTWNSGSKSLYGYWQKSLEIL